MSPGRKAPQGLSGELKDRLIRQVMERRVRGPQPEPLAPWAKGEAAHPGEPPPVMSKRARKPEG